MAIFLLKNEFGEFKNIKPIKRNEQLCLVDNYGYPMLNTWQPINFEWDIEDGNKPRDIFLYLGYILIGNGKSVSALRMMIDNSKCEILPIKIDKEEYYVFNICETLVNVLDRRKSKIEYFKDKSIKWISQYVFSPDYKDTPIFHIAEMSSPIFVSDTIVEYIKEAGLIGLKFEECKQDKSSFFKSIFK